MISKHSYEELNRGEVRLLLVAEFMRGKASLKHHQRPYFLIKLMGMRMSHVKQVNGDFQPIIEREGCLFKLSLEGCSYIGGGSLSKLYGTHQPA